MARTNKNIFNEFSGLGRFVSDWEEDQPEDPDREPMDQSDRGQSFWPLSLLTLVAALLLVGRLFGLQVFQGVENRFQAEGNRIRSQLVTAPRGVIYDRTGKALASNRPAYFLTLIPVSLPKGVEERKDIYQKIEVTTGISTNEIEQLVKDHSSQLEPVVIRENVNRDSALLWKIKLEGVPAVVVESRPIRDYITSPNLAHLLGYIGPVTPEELKTSARYRYTSITGKTGLEATYEDYLQGIPGRREVEVDSSGGVRRELKNLSPIAGNNLKLSLDFDLQKIANDSLSTWITKSGGTSGVALAVDVKTGGLLTFVSLPGYDNNIFSTGAIRDADYQRLLIDKKQPLIDRAISGLFPPGSSIKPIVAASGLQEQVITPQTSIVTPAEIKIGEYSFPDWKYHPGSSDVRRAIAESNNIFFYSVGGGYGPIGGLGPDRLAKYFSLFGIGEKTGIDLPGEIEGFVPTPDWKQRVKNEPWYIGDTYHESIGQGDLVVTPIQHLMALAAIAGDGNLLEPHLVNEITDSKGNPVKTVGRVVKRANFIDSQNLAVIREGMRQTVASGSAQSLNSLPFEIAGKTGTAQFGTANKTHAWFLSFAPYSNPEIAVLVFIEGGGEGYQSAAPVAAEVYRQYFKGR